MATKHALELIVWTDTRQVTAIRENTENGKVSIHQYYNVNKERLDELADIGNYHREELHTWILVRAAGWSINTAYRNQANLSLSPRYP